MAGRRLRRIGAILITVVGLTVILALSTSEVALVTTHGISMEPRFHTGDLAVIVPAAQYRVGEIVGYHSPLLHIVVLHRIVAEHAGLFTFKGDNNSFLDPVRLPPSAVEGRLWLHVPHGGTVLGWFRSPVVLGVLAFLVIALGVGGVSRRRRVRGPAAGPDSSGVTSHHPAPTTAKTGWWPIALALTLVGAFGLLNLAAWTRSTTHPSQGSLPYQQHVSFSYLGTATAGIIYPTGQATTGSPVFLHLVDALEVGVQYFIGPTAPGPATGAVPVVTGTIGVTATMQGPGGWTGQLAHVAPVKFSGTSASVGIALDLSQIPALEQAFTAQTGVPLADPQIVVTPAVHVHGTLAGGGLATSFVPALTFQVEGQVLDLVSPSAGGGGALHAPLVVSRSGSVGHRTTVPSHMAVLGHSVAVSEVRRLALGGLVLSILGAVAAWAWRRRRGRMDETTRIHADYGRDLVAVSASPAVKAPLVVDVETFEELARLARRYECVILEHAHVGGHAYYVETGSTLYRSGVEYSEPAPASAAHPEDCAIVAAPATPPDEAVAAADGPPERGLRRRLRPSPPVAVPDTARIADEVDVLTCLARAEWVSGVGDAGAHLREAVTLARKARLDQAMVDALLVNVRMSFDQEQASDPEKIELLEHALALPGDTPARRARLLGALAVESIFTGDGPRRGPLLDEALALARASGDPRALVEVSASRFLARPRSTWTAAQFTADRPLFAEAVDTAATLGDPIWVATTQTHAAFAALVAGDGERLRAHVTALSDISAGGQNQIALRAHLLLGQCVATLEGRLADAEALSREASEMWRMPGLAQTNTGRALALFPLRREQSRLPELVSDLTVDGPERPPAAVATAAMAFALVESGARDDAAILLHRAAHSGFHDIPDDVDWPMALALWAEVASRIGDRRAAAELYEILRPHDATQMCTGAVDGGPAARLLAVLEDLLGRPTEADRHFAEAIAFSARLVSPVWVARCQLDWAQTWIERGETASAAQLVEDADAAAGMLALPALRLQWASLQDQLDRT